MIRPHAAGNGAVQSARRRIRVHYAGFMDPGFGHAAAGGHGSRVVLEVRSHKVPLSSNTGKSSAASSMSA